MTSTNIKLFILKLQTTAKPIADFR